VKLEPDKVSGELLAEAAEKVSRGVAKYVVIAYADEDYRVLGAMSNVSTEAICVGLLEIVKALVMESYELT
jgi:hypothetical protein